GDVDERFAVRAGQGALVFGPGHRLPGDHQVALRGDAGGRERVVTALAHACAADADVVVVVEAQVALAQLAPRVLHGPGHGPAQRGGGPDRVRGTGGRVVAPAAGQQRQGGGQDEGGDGLHGGIPMDGWSRGDGGDGAGVTAGPPGPAVRPGQPSSRQRRRRTAAKIMAAPANTPPHRSTLARLRYTPAGLISCRAAPGRLKSTSRRYSKSMKVIGKMLVSARSTTLRKNGHVTSPSTPRNSSHATRIPASSGSTTAHRNGLLRAQDEHSS